MRLAIETAIASVPNDKLTEALATRPLLVVLHGFGSNEQDLMRLTPHLPADFVTIALRAPLTAGPGYSWFPIESPGDPRSEVADDAAAAILEWLDGLAQGLTVGGPIVLLGFSQGAAMVTHLMRHRPDAFLAGVALSGFSIGELLPGDAGLAATRPPLFWGRDDADPVITRAAIERTSEWMPGHFTVDEHLYPGIGHSVSQQELSDISDFLVRVLDGR